MKDMALSNPNRVIEILRKKCGKKFTTKELAQILAEKYSEKCEEKISTTKPENKEQCIRQVSAEISSNISENYFDKFSCVEVTKKDGKKALMYRCNCKENDLNNENEEEIKQKSDIKDKCIESEKISRGVNRKMGGRKIMKC